MNKDIVFHTKAFNTKVTCYYKDVNDGCYDVYIKGLCIACSLDSFSLGELKSILTWL